ncbi:MAG: alanine--tRNA ligase [Candidatus Aenigmatarchaeota archaeon]
MPLDKKELRAKFAKDWQKYYKLDFLVQNGFERKVCRRCGKGFWTLDSKREFCQDQPCQYYEFLGNPPTSRRFEYIEAWKHIEKFFVRNGHTSIRRYPVVCRWFPSLYFNAASIVNFYRTENGNVVFDFPANPLVVPQFCLRFNDIPNIGVTGRHYGCFVMVGQHSVHNPRTGSGYWKERCTELDFELLKSFGIAPEEIMFIEDVWLGPGAFGSTLEFFVRGLEVGNEVFTEFVITDAESGTFREMDEKVIDMGAGLERFAWLSQGTPTSYDVTFKPVLAELRKHVHIDYDEKLFLEYSRLAGALNFDEVADVKKARQAIADKLNVDVWELERKIEPMQALYAICDHTRALAFAIADGALPSNVAGGYNLRVVLRRALGFVKKFGWKLDLADVCEMHAKQLTEMAPELAEHADEIRKILDVEERRYEETKERARKIVERVASSGKALDDETLIKLYDSDGITPEMIAEEKPDLKVPADFYVRITERHLAQKKDEEARPFDVSGIPKTRILYYDEPEALEFGAKVVKVLGEKEDRIALDQTAFYPTSGGQMFDAGTINGIEVADVNKYGDVVVHTLKEGGKLKEGNPVECAVDAKRRRILRQNHTGNHVLNLSARAILGPHVWQHSALKDVDKAKLEITHYDALSDDDVKKIEDYANAVVKKAVPVDVEMLPRGEAEQKYGFRIYQGSQGVPSREVRIISVGDLDHAACGGLHCISTSEVGFITILHTKRVQDGVVRIEYVCGDVAVQRLEEKEQLLKEAADALGAREGEVPAAVKRLFEEWKEKRKLAKKAK